MKCLLQLLLSIQNSIYSYRTMYCKGIIFNNYFIFGIIYNGIGHAKDFYEAPNILQGYGGTQYPMAQGLPLFIGAVGQDVTVPSSRAI